MSIAIHICWMLIALLFAATTTLAAENGSFRLDADGSVEVDGQTFTSLAAYADSDYFREHGKRCGTRTPARNAVYRDIADCTAVLTRIQDEYWPVEVTYYIPVYFHVIYKSDGTGNISEERIQEQLAVLNEDFGAPAETLGSEGFNTRIQFELAGITRTQNDLWFGDSTSQVEVAYKKALGEDQDLYLNVYSNSADGYLGYSYFPQSEAGTVLDGVVVLYEAVGGRDNGYGNYNQGRTLVHEIGHYLGLYHTFEGGSTCENSYGGGDFIVDTNAESEEHYGCTQTYTCGVADPIDNYMNYTDDSCMAGFTGEQANRAVCSLVNYRPDLYRVVNDENGVSEFSWLPSVLLLLRQP